jgi:GH24 family phage-related lysozyme (muramidase)
MNAPSGRAIALIERFEVGDPSSYSPNPCWPGGASGLTIGVGYDLGYATPVAVASDWQALPDAVCHRLQSYTGRTGAAAASLAAAAYDITVPYSLARTVFEQCDIPRTTTLTATAFPNTDQLSPDSLGALVSLVFNRGAAMTDTRPGNRLEMRQIRDAMRAQDFASIPGYLRAMKRLWAGTGQSGLLTRRDAEADLFAAGLLPTT